MRSNIWYYLSRTQQFLKGNYMDFPGSSALYWNIWGHRVPLGINISLMEAALTTDVMCLTEVTHMATPYHPVPAVHTSEDRDEPPTFINGLEQLIQNLNEQYEVRYMSPRVDQFECLITKCTYDNVGFGSALLFRRDLRIVTIGESLIPVDDRKRARVLQWIVYDKGNHRYLVAHLHGLWIKGNTKGNDPRRNHQSIQVLAHLDVIKRQHGVEKVLFGGDLNLDYGTEALRILEANESFGDPLVNLITKYGITDTRTERYRKRKEKHLGASMYADWVLTSPNVAVHDFTVDNSNGASDHAPLYVRFS